MKTELLFVEPIKFIKHPKSQTAKEGSKIEFTCKVQGKSSRLLYQWFKDDGSVRGQTEASLVLKSVELRDFGRYKCYVSYEDRFGEGETSSPAVLNVIPQHLNGMSKYCLFMCSFLPVLLLFTRKIIAWMLYNMPVFIRPGSVNWVDYQHFLFPGYVHLVRNEKTLASGK